MLPSYSVPCTALCMLHNPTYSLVKYHFIEGLLVYKGKQEEDSDQYCGMNYTLGEKYQNSQEY